MRIGILISMVLTGVIALSGAAMAHCGSCGVGEAAHPAACSCEGCSAHQADGHPADCDCKGCSAHGDFGKHAEITSCPGCGMDGGLCAHCEGGAENLLRDMAIGFCPNCESPDGLCEMCEDGVSGALDRMGGLTANVMSAPAHSMAYVAGTMSSDMEALFNDLVQAAGQQGLMNENTHVGSAYPFAMEQGWGPDSVVYAGISFAEGVTPSAPLEVFTVPAGSYLVFDHIGPYEHLGYTWMAAFAYAKMSGVELGTGAAGEHYVSDPGSTPEDELLTQIFIPVTGHGDEHGHGA